MGKDKDGLWKKDKGKGKDKDGLRNKRRGLCTMDTLVETNKTGREEDNANNILMGTIESSGVSEGNTKSVNERNTCEMRRGEDMSMGRMGSSGLFEERPQQWRTVDNGHLNFKTTSFSNADEVEGNVNFV